MLPNPLTAPDPLPPNIPVSLHPSLAVRIAVFVAEQHCRLETEVDADDPRSHHWTLFATPALPPEATISSTPTTDAIPAATLRLVPPPHGPHPLPASVDGVGGTRALVVAHDDAHGEPYIKLGRLATLPAFRGQGLAKRLVTEVLEWAGREPGGVFCGPGGGGVVGRDVGRSGEVGGEAVGAVGERGEAVAERTEEGTWRGLVLVHAQENAQRFWARCGFVRDEALGTWFEEGIVHAGMWRRVDVRW
jgi:predicted GNAT family N-acyltransferase